jgi:anthranilate synthase/aminodeoxychorismate synthase-like glutamine amidotransferase
MIIVVDHYDSFVYNLVHYVALSGASYRVISHDDPLLIDLNKLGASGVILSPGPCSPAETAHTLPMIQRYGHRMPMLGVCLGHQCLGAAFGVPVIPSSTPVHGRDCEIFHLGHRLFDQIPSPFRAGRYHSLMLPEEGNPLDPFVSLAHSEDGLNMAIAHRAFPLYGVQFHPESILTPEGLTLIRNFIGMVESFHANKPMTHG